jgi:ectoine hydroxylase-related dioxygenase (phytanoyl-CoA dioxygenase family)
MDEYQRYFFDLNGYLVIENALSSEEVGACNAAIDRNWASTRLRMDEERLSGQAAALQGQQGRRDLFGMLTWPEPDCLPFRHLLAHPAIAPTLSELLGEGFRLDHLYGIGMTAGTEGHVLHGGGASRSLTNLYQYHAGKIRCGLTVVSWQLADVGPGDGGFCCIPGSHKANFPLPREVAQLERDLHLVRQVVAPAGSVLVFTEALTHGTMPWRAEHERRSLLYKYSPGPMSYSSRYIPEGMDAHLDSLPPAQRAVLEPPYEPGRPGRT